MDNLPSSFSRPSKIILVICITGIIFSTGYYLGTKAPTNPRDGTPSKTLTQLPTLPPPVSKQKVQGGFNNQNPAFRPYSIEIPEDWKTRREDRPMGTDTLTIFKGKYSLTIDQAAFGEGGIEGEEAGCLYPGDPFTTKAQTFTDFIQIQEASEDLRRSWIGEGAPAPIIAYTVCMRTADNSYSSITSYGKINAISLNPPHAIPMKEIDEMIASIVFQPVEKK